MPTAAARETDRYRFYLRLDRTTGPLPTPHDSHCTDVNRWIIVFLVEKRDWHRDLFIIVIKTTMESTVKVAPKDNPAKVASALRRERRSVTVQGPAPCGGFRRV